MPWHQGVLLIPSIDLRAREPLVFRAAEQSFGAPCREIGGGEEEDGLTKKTDINHRDKCC